MGDTVRIGDGVTGRPLVDQPRFKDYKLELTMGHLTDYEVVHKFGRNAAIGTTFEPLSIDGIYQTPTTPTALEVVSSSSNDTALGSGAQQVIVEGIKSSWDTVSDEAFELNGQTAVSIGSWLRIFRMWVSRTGTYATSAAGSHAGNITIQGDGGGAEWMKIDVTDFPRGQSQVGCYTIPAGYHAVIEFDYISVNGNKSMDAIFFRREIANDTATPFSGVMRTIIELDGLDGYIPMGQVLRGPYNGPCDIGWMVKAAGTTIATCDFTIYLENS